MPWVCPRPRTCTTVGTRQERLTQAKANAARERTAQNEEVKQLQVELMRVREAARRLEGARDASKEPAQTERAQEKQEAVPPESENDVAS